MTTGETNVAISEGVAPVGIRSTDWFSESGAPKQAGGAAASNFPLVLDACCSVRAFWFDKRDRRALFMDRRNETCEIPPDKGHPARKLEVRPDVVADFTEMPFPDESFWHVVFDPPHARFGESSVMAKTYGTLLPGWREMIRGGFEECFRVLKPNGTLIFKWCAWEIPIADVLELTPEKPLYGHISGRRADTYWIAFVKHTGAVAPAPEEGDNVGSEP